jgi:hypothetical protein
MPGVAQGPIEFEVPGLGPIQIPTDKDKLEKLAAQVDIASAIVSAVLYLFTALMLFLMATKTGTSLPWLAFIPIANIILMVRVAGKPLWWLVLLFLPILAPLAALVALVDPTGGIVVAVLVGAIILVTIVAWLLVCIGMARARGKSAIWGVLLFIPCLNLIALGYLGLSR